jgi:hypothetical protein
VAEAQGEVAGAAPGKTQNEPWYVSSYAIIGGVTAVDHGAVAARYTSWRVTVVAWFLIVVAVL